MSRSRAHLGPWRPLAVPDAGLALVRAPVQAVVVVALGKLVQAALVGVDGVTDVAEDVPAVPVVGWGAVGGYVSVCSGLASRWLLGWLVSSAGAAAEMQERLAGRMLAVGQGREQPSGH